MSCEARIQRIFRKTSRINTSKLNCKQLRIVVQAIQRSMTCKWSTCACRSELFIEPVWTDRLSNFCMRNSLAWEPWWLSLGLIISLPEAAEQSKTNMIKENRSGGHSNSYWLPVKHWSMSKRNFHCNSHYPTSVETLYHPLDSFGEVLSHILTGKKNQLRSLPVGLATSKVCCPNWISCRPVMVILRAIQKRPNGLPRSKAFTLFWNHN